MLAANAVHRSAREIAVNLNGAPGNCKKDQFEYIFYVDLERREFLCGSMRARFTIVRDVAVRRPASAVVVTMNGRPRPE